MITVVQIVGPDPAEEPEDDLRVPDGQQRDGDPAHASHDQENSTYSKQKGRPCFFPVLGIRSPPLPPANKARKLPPFPLS